MFEIENIRDLVCQTIDPADGDYLRFLWVNDVNLENPQLKVYSFARLVFGLYYYNYYYYLILF